MKPIKVLSIIGTRPEVIKMAPVIKELERREGRFLSTVIITGQHKEMCQPYLNLFSIEPDYDLSIMRKDQTLNMIVSSILSSLPAYLVKVHPDVMLVQGDTSSAFAAALCAYHNKTLVGHVEAGLRTGDKYNPFPEEMNRRLIGTIADLHFAPTPRSRDNLLAAGVPGNQIFVTGNTVIDALKLIVRNDYAFNHELLSILDYDSKRIICVTTHRRESFGEPLRNVLSAIKKIVAAYADVEVIIPVHYNPNVRSKIHELLGHVERVHLIEPLPYETFVQLLNKTYLILTDSGGIQEEAPSLSKPVLVLRETTERPEGIEAGTARLIGTDTQAIVSAVQELLENPESYKRMISARNPYGDGNAAVKIVEVLQNTFG